MGAKKSGFWKTEWFLGLMATVIALAASGGVHTASDAIKAILAGASAVQVVSALLKHGPPVIATMLANT